MVSEEVFAQEEKRTGKQIHFHDGVWWEKAAYFYYKPVHVFRPFPPKSAKPNSVKALLGYSHQVPDASQATRHLRWNVLTGEDLRCFSLERLNSKRRNLVRKGIKSCRVDVLSATEEIVEQMRCINISQARRFESSGIGGSFLSSEYYDLNSSTWRKDMMKLFNHQGHRFVGAFVDDMLVAYINIIQVEDTWMFGAVKSLNDYLKYSPLDALYFTTLSMAAQDDACKRVVNGGGDERKSLVHFKEEFLLKSVLLPYYTKTLLPIDRLLAIKRILALQKRNKSVAK